MKQIVVGFSVFDFQKDYLDKLSDREKHEHYLETSSSQAYDNVNDFFYELNDDRVDTENYFWYLINISE